MDAVVSNYRQRSKRGRSAGAMTRREDAQCPMTNDQCPVTSAPEQAPAVGMIESSLVIGIWSLIGHWSLVIARQHRVIARLRARSFQLKRKICPPSLDSAPGSYHTLVVPAWDTIAQ
jgi:hypothetical protein